MVVLGSAFNSSSSDMKLEARYGCSNRSWSRGTMEQEVVFKPGDSILAQMTWWLCISYSVFESMLQCPSGGS